MLQLKRLTLFRTKSQFNCSFFSTESVEWSKLTSGVKCFNNLYGEALIPVDFAVPAASVHWPPNLHGYQLGKQAMLARPLTRRPKYKAQWIKLKKFGFVQRSHQQSSLVVLKALHVYKNVFGDFEIMRQFIIPTGPSDPSPSEVAANRWPRSTWGLKLGLILNSIRYHNQHKSIHSEMIEMGIVMDSLREKNYDCVYRALKIYLKLYGDVKVPRKFIVPENDEDEEENVDDEEAASHGRTGAKALAKNKPVSDWPEDLAGLRLGDVVHNIKYHRYYEEAHGEELQALGIVYSTSAHRDSQPAVSHPSSHSEEEQHLTTKV